MYVIQPPVPLIYTLASQDRLLPVPHPHPHVKEPTRAMSFPYTAPVVQGTATLVPYDLHMNSAADVRVRNALYNVRSLTHTHTHNFYLE